MHFLIGLALSLFSIIWAIIHLRQQASNYIDPVGIAVVIGGTIAVAVIIFPWSLMREMKESLKALVGTRKIDYKLLTHECLEVFRMIQSGQTRYTPKEKSIAHQTLTDGVELISLGFKRERLHVILDERVHSWMERRKQVANSVRSLAKYPPAFGLVGTVLGLVSLMRAISDGASSTEAGFRMSVALVATLYGLLASNLLLNPAGESILHQALEEKKAGELALEAILLASEGVTLLEAQETLNSRIAPHERVNLMGGATTDATESEVAA